MPNVAPFKKVAAPRLDYFPPVPKRYRPRIGLIGCGGITSQHLTAYRKAGWEVVAMCATTPKNALKRRDEFYPDAAIYTDHRKMLKEADLDVVDIATHPEVRFALIKDALEAGCHVLSQKPFVLDLKQGRTLIDFADRKGLRLAVNQNARWAPYFSYMRQAVLAGLLGDLQTVDVRINWDHTWCQGTAFEKIHHLILYDFGIHWLDIVSCFFGEKQATRVSAAAIKASGQTVIPPYLAHAAIEYPNGLATLSFNGLSKFGGNESITLVGSTGTIQCDGPLCQGGNLRLFTKRGIATPILKGHWFPDGFLGSMGELLCAIKEKREPANSARNNLKSLELCFAAMESADSGKPQIPGKVIRSRKNAVNSVNETGPISNQL